MEIIFIQFAIILTAAFLLCYLIRLLKQPVIIGYILAGIIISPFILYSGSFNLITGNIIKVCSDFGVAFLLFMVGLHLNPKVIKEIGKLSLIVGIVQMLVIFVLGYFVSHFLLGFNTLTSSYIGIALMFSSTIIVMKLILDKGELENLYSKISIGILIVQDLVAMVILMLISLTGNLNLNEILTPVILKELLSIAIIFFVLFILGYFMIPKVTRSIAKSQELLFLFSLCWFFLIASCFSYFGFSVEIGALIAGVILSTSPYSTEISSKIKPLRDFFLIILFIFLGLKMNLLTINLPIIYNALILSGVVLIFKPIILMGLMAWFGYTKRNNFLVGTTLAQISEFSLIILALGVSLGHVSSEILSILTLTALITITLSTYMVMFSTGFYSRIFKFLSLFERKNTEKKEKLKKKYNAILFGYNRIGFGILNALKKIKMNYLIIDFNPDIISDLQKLRIPALYGDAYDFDLLDELPLDKVELVVSTIPDFDTNALLIENIRSVNPNALIIVRAHQVKEALELYKCGATYVLTPHFLGGEHLSRMIENLKIDEKGYLKEKEMHIKMLKERLRKGVS